MSKVAFYFIYFILIILEFLIFAFLCIKIKLNGIIFSEIIGRDINNYGAIVNLLKVVPLLIILRLIFVHFKDVRNLIFIIQNAFLFINVLFDSSHNIKNIYGFFWLSVIINISFLIVDNFIYNYLKKLMQT